ncbi:hypothetical protein KQH62_04350 [bacterium]|nr:hypothetical protein [bacterium]
MNKKLVFVIGVLILAALACNLPWQNTPEPTEDTAVPHSTEMETETAAPVETETETPTTVTVEPSALPLPIVYYAAPDLIALDPLDGSDLLRLPAANFGFAGYGGVSGNGVFYVNSDYDQAYRIGFDSVQQELTFLNPGGDSFAGVILPSPDGTQIAHGEVLSFTAVGSDNQLKTVNLDGTGEQILVAETGLEQALRPTPIKWSADGTALYFMNVIEGIEGFGGLDLLKVDLGTGSVETIFPDSGSLTSTSVSPGETYAARAVAGDPLSIVIRDLAAGTDQTVTLPARFRQAWQMVWAPDDSSLLVTLGLGMRESDEYSVARIDPKTLDLEFLISDDPTLPRAVAWQVPETIWFNDRDGALWMMDAVSLGTTTVVAADARVISISR